MSAVAFSAEASNKRGPRPALLPFGGGECQAVVAADLSPTFRTILLACPDEDFARFGHLKLARVIDSIVRRGFIEACGYHRNGQWQYRLTAFGRAVRDAIV